jgi:peroxiredoxin
MRTWSFALLGALASAGMFGQTVAPPKTHLKVGDAAPEFNLPSTQGGRVKLSELKGNTVVLAFFPAAFTGGWTKEFQAYQAGIAKFDAAGAKVFGISTDNIPSQREFAQKNNIAVPFLSDFAKREVAAAYGVLNQDAGVANRSTFVIDPEGKITYIEEGNTAIDPVGATDACSRSAHKAGK